VLWHPQLPHGGSYIKEPARTRNSLVVHSTPTGTPVYQKNAFFNPHAPFSDSPGWAYWQYPQANVLAQDRIDIMHQKQVLVRDLA
jgi:phytanoyl-CoA hydroxylase